MFRVEEDAQFGGDVQILGDLNCSDASIPMSKLSDTAGDLSAQKVTQQRVFTVDFAGANPATGRVFVGRAKAAWTAKYCELYIGDAPSSGTLTIAPKYCDGVGGALSALLSASLTSTSADSDRTVKSGTFATSSGAAGTVFELDVTAATAAAAIGFTLCIEEAAYA